MSTDIAFFEPSARALTANETAPLPQASEVASLSAFSGVLQGLLQAGSTALPLLEEPSGSPAGAQPVDAAQRVTSVQTPALGPGELAPVADMHGQRKPVADGALLVAVAALPVPNDFQVSPAPASTSGVRAGTVVTGVAAAASRKAVSTTTGGGSSDLGLTGPQIDAAATSGPAVPPPAAFVPATGQAAEATADASKASPVLPTRFVAVLGGLLPAITQRGSAVEAREPAPATETPSPAAVRARAAAQATPAAADAVLTTVPETGAPRVSTSPSLPQHAAARADLPAVAKTLPSDSDSSAAPISQRATDTIAALETSAPAKPVLEGELRLPANQTHWRQPLMQALGERIEVSTPGVGRDQAVIRLDPPHLGHVEIVIRQDSSGTHVLLTATNSEVAGQLRHIADGLRGEMHSRFSGEVSVQVSDGSAQQGGGRQQSPNRQYAQDSDPGQGLAEAGGTRDNTFTVATETNQT